jgi:chloride channel protein, CIC family
MRRIAEPCWWLAPLGGALFSIEVLYRNQEMETESLIPAVISSLVAFSLFSAITGQTQVFHTPVFAFHPKELLPYAILGLVCAVVGVLYVLVFYGARDYFFKKIPVKPHFLPMIGGLLLGGLALMRPEVLSGGYGWLEEALNGNLPIKLMIILVFAKLIATSLTISSGGSGGVFGPSLFIGTMLGAAFGDIFNAQFPGWILDTRSFALVGMVAFFSGIAKVPIASLLMITEMSNSYTLLVPMMLVSSLTYIFTDRWSLYEEQVRSKSDSPAHYGEYRTDVLAGLKVREIAFENHVITIPFNMTLRQILPLVLDTQQNVFPVMNERDEMTGTFSVEDLRNLFLEEHMRDLIVAIDIANPDFEHVTPDEDLHSVLRKLTAMVIDEIPVLDSSQKRFIGLVKRHDILHLYSRKLYEIERIGLGHEDGHLMY